MESAGMPSEKMEPATGFTTMIKRRRMGSTINKYYYYPNKEEEEEQVTVSVTVPYSSSISSFVVPDPTTFIRTICLWGYHDNDKTLIDWFVLKVSIDLQKQTVTNKQVRKLAAFDHIHLHRHHHQYPNKNEQEEKRPIFSYKKKREGGDVPLWGSSFATLGPFLYSVGGSFYYRTVKYNSLHTSPKKHRNRTNLVHYFDTTTSSGNNTCWIKAPSMITARMSPQVISLNRMLYVFGCCKGSRKCRHSPECLVWSEVYDPSLGLWTALPDPPFSMNLVICSPNHINHRSTTKILAIADKRKVYELDTLTNLWAFKFEFLTPWRGNEYHRPVLVDDVLYWFDDNINAYDVSTDKTFTGPVQDISFQRCMRLRPNCYDGYNCIGNTRPAIFHLGGSYFCLLGFELFTVHHGSDIYDTSQRIHCLTIKLSRTKECYKRFGLPGLDISNFFLRGGVISCQSFPINRGGRSYIDGCFLCDA